MNILFVCTANSARSLIAEALLRQLAGDRMQVSSAGTEPTTAHPRALAALQRRGIATDNLRSKSLDSLADTQFDYVISLCDRARKECQPMFSGQNFISWDFPDPVAEDSDAAFDKTVHELSERIRMFLLIQDKRDTAKHLFNAPTDFFKVMADPLRLQMLLLLQRGELCVCDLVDATGMSQPKVSRHLAQLREYGLLLDRKDSRWVYYRLNPAMPDWMAKIIATTAEYNPMKRMTS